MIYTLICIKKFQFRRQIMNANIQPDYHDVEIECACGEKFFTKSTKPGDKIKIDICNKCHPFFTGKQKIVDANGKVERFQKRHNL